MQPVLGREWGMVQESLGGGDTRAEEAAQAKQDSPQQRSEIRGPPLPLYCSVSTSEMSTTKVPVSRGAWEDAMIQTGSSVHSPTYSRFSRCGRYYYCYCYCYGCSHHPELHAVTFADGATRVGSPCSHSRSCSQGPDPGLHTPSPNLPAQLLWDGRPKLGIWD